MNEFEVRVASVYRISKGDAPWVPMFVHGDGAVCAAGVGLERFLERPAGQVIKELIAAGYTVKEGV